MRSYPNCPNCNREAESGKPVSLYKCGACGVKYCTECGGGACPTCSAESRTLIGRVAK